MRLRLPLKILLALPLPLLLLFLSAGYALAQEAQLVSVMGRAEILSEGTWREARKGDRILPGAAVRTYADGEASVSAEEGRIEIKVRPGSELGYEGIVNTGSRPWKDGLPYRPVGLESLPEGERSPQFSLPEG